MNPATIASTNVLTQDEATRLGTKLLDVGSSTRIEHVARAVTRIANGRVLMHEDGTQLLLDLRPGYSNGSEIGVVVVTTSQPDDAAIQALLKQAAALTHGEVNTPTPVERPERYTFTPVSLWHASTVQAMEDGRRDAVERILSACRAARVIGAATIGLVERSVMYMKQSGITAYCRETDAELTVTIRLPDGGNTGWAGQTMRDWATCNVDDIVQRAIDVARRGANPHALEPGRRRVILGPGAVVQLMRYLAPSFDAKGTDDGRTPFSKTPKGGNLLGRQVIDPRVMMSSDPNDPDGGFPPFFERADDLLDNSEGLPVPALTWIKQGVLKNLSYNVSYGLLKGKPYSTKPYAIRVEAEPGVHTATVDEMIAACDDGIYVNRLSNVEMLDTQTGMLTGVTRDGCFLVRNGKIDRPVKNFRFIESPIHCLNRLDLIGRAERGTFGHTPPSLEDNSDGRGWPPRGRIAQWPQLPVVVPPMMIRDFNFSGLSDAV